MSSQTAAGIAARRAIGIVLVAFALTMPGAEAGEGLLVLTTAAGSCDDGSGDRYVACGNGTVTDTQHGLVWLENANCFGALSWRDAMATVAGLASGDCGLTDGSSPGDWRLASLPEWQAAVADAVFMSCVSPALTDNSGALCLAAGVTSFTNVQSSVYWSATTVAATPGNARTMTLFNGAASSLSKNNANFVWPVRYAQ